MLKKSIKKLSLVLSAVMLICVLLVPLSTVSAFGAKTGTIYAGSSSTITCNSGEVRYLDVYVTQTGFYRLDVTNNSGGERCTVAIFDDATETEVAYWYNYINGTKTIDQIFLSANKSYTLTLGRFDQDGRALSSSFGVKLEKYDFNPTAINSTAKNISFSSTETQWLTYTPSATGDYAFKTNGFTGFIDVYNASTGEHVYKRVDTDWYDYTPIYDSYQDAIVETGWTQRSKVVLNLNANTKYYFLVSCYDYNNKNPQISIALNTSYAASNIQAVAQTNKYAPLSVINQAAFNYKVIYANGTTSTYDYKTLCQNGYIVPEVEFLGSYVDVGEYRMLRGIKSPVRSTYNGKSEIFYINISSCTDNLSIVSGAVNDTYRCYIQRGTTEGIFRVKMNQTGYYSWSDYYNNQKINNILEYYYACMIDEQNNIVKFDEKMMGWPLVAGREYAFFIFYDFRSSQPTTEYSFKFSKNTANAYPDVAKGAWYSDAVTHVSGRGIMSGYSNGKFGTSDGIQRQDFLVMLARLEGVDLQSYKLSNGKFPDVSRGSYYEAAVAWGAENGIVTGYNNGKFGVGDKITREQIVTFLYRYAKYDYADMSGAVSESQLNRTYKDYKNVSSFAREAMAWAVGKGVISGKTSNTIVPQGNAQRCEVAKIMYNIFINDVF